MPRGRPPKESTLERALTVEEREGMEKDLQKKEEMLQATEEFAEGRLSTVIPAEVSISKGKIAEDIKRTRRMLDENTPQRALGEVRARLEAERKRLEDEFDREQVIETWRDLGAIHMSSPEYKEAFKKGEMRHKWEAKITRWKEICKRLEPEDPRYCNLDRLRKDK